MKNSKRNKIPQDDSSDDDDETFEQNTGTYIVEQLNYNPIDDNDEAILVPRNHTPNSDHNQQQIDEVNIQPRTNETQQSYASEFNHNIPLDRYNYTYLIFYLLGMTTMTPWNFFVTAEDYWLYKFRNVTESTADLTPMQKSFISDLTVTASMSGTISLILNAVYGHLLSLNFKINGSMTIILGFFIFTTAFVEVNTDDWQAIFFILTLVTVVIMNTFSALMSGGLFGIAGLFPSEYMTAVVSGQSLGGIFTALAFILALTFNASGKTTALVYFLIGNVILIISIITYVIMTRTQFFQYHVYDKNTPIVHNDHHNNDVEGEILDNSNNIGEMVVLMPNLKEVFTKIYCYAIVLTLTIGATLCVYPVVTVLIESENHGNGNKWNDVYFLPVVNYLTFNSGDYLGRILAGLWEIPKNNSHLCLMLTVLRFVFIPLFLLSNCSHVYLPTYIKSDSTLIIMMILFAMSNGYLANIAMISVPKNVMQHEKEMASSIMAACMSIGITIGACCSMFLVQIL